MVLAPPAPSLDVLDWLTRGGAIAVLSLGIVGFLRAWIIPAPTHRSIVEDKDQQIEDWKSLARRGTAAAQAATHGLEKVVEHVREASDQELVEEVRSRGLIP